MPTTVQNGRISLQAEKKKNKTKSEIFNYKTETLLSRTFTQQFNSKTKIFMLWVFQDNKMVCSVRELRPFLQFRCHTDKPNVVHDTYRGKVLKLPTIFENSKTGRRKKCVTPSLFFKPHMQHEYIPFILLHPYKRILISAANQSAFKI